MGGSRRGPDEDLGGEHSWVFRHDGRGDLIRDLVEVALDRRAGLRRCWRRRQMMSRYLPFESRARPQRPCDLRVEPRLASRQVSGHRRIMVIRAPLTPGSPA